MPRQRERECPSGKVCYDYKSQAEAYAKAYNWKHPGQMKTMVAYGNCQHECGFWHNATDKSVLRRTAKKKRQRKRQRQEKQRVLAAWENEGGTYVS